MAALNASGYTGDLKIFIPYEDVELYTCFNAKQYHRRECIDHLLPLSQMLLHDEAQLVLEHGGDVLRPLLGFECFAAGEIFIHRTKEV